MLQVSSLCSMGSLSLWLLCPHFSWLQITVSDSPTMWSSFQDSLKNGPFTQDYAPVTPVGLWQTGHGLLKPSPYPAWRLAGHLYIILFQGFSSIVSSLDVPRALWLKAVWLLMWWLKASTVIIPGSKVEGVGSPRWLRDKESACQCRRHRRCGFDPCVGKIPWRRKW